VVPGDIPTAQCALRRNWSMNKEFIVRDDAGVKRSGQDRIKMISMSFFM
jgi:hypothetical protein